MFRQVSLSDVDQLPRWRQPVVLLFLMALAMPMAFNAWNALLNNFIIEMAQFDGQDNGLLHTVREIPGFLAIGVIFILLFVREQILAVVSLLLLGTATAMTAWFPSMGGILMITLLSSIGFHYYETVNQSLQLQWLSKERAPKVLGWLVSAGSVATLVVYLAIRLLWEPLDLSYNAVYMTAGGASVALTLVCLFAFPQFESPTPQTKKLILRRRYWLYYALQFMAGARRQIFVVFAAFMMVQKFGLAVDQVVNLYMINLAVTIGAAPFIGKLVARFGERRTLLVEYAGLAIVFAAYGGIYWFGWGVLIASALYVVDHIFFAMSLALKTYFQKIADPADIAPTAAVAFTINHIAAVCLPVPLGILWDIAPAWVFTLAAGMALVSLSLALLIPRHPEPGNETVFAMWRRPAPAE